MSYFNFFSKKIPESLPQVVHSCSISIDVEINSCSVCLEENIVRENIFTLDCKHTFCYTCLKGFFEEKIKSGKIQNIKCPQDGCNMTLFIIKFSKLLSKEYINLYEKHLALKDLRRDPNLALVAPIISPLTAL